MQQSPIIIMFLNKKMKKKKKVNYIYVNDYFIFHVLKITYIQT